MNQFGLIEFGRLIRDLQLYECACEMSELRDGAGHVKPEVTEVVLKLFEDTQAVALKIGNQELLDLAATSATNVKHRADINVASLRVYTQTVKDSILRYAFYGKFLYVEHDRREMIDKPTLLGSQVSLVFPNAMADIRDAGNRLAAEFNTAAVFHLMRVVEWGLRYLCASVQLTALKQTTKGGKVKSTPLSYSQWEDMLNQLQLKIDAKLKGTKKVPRNNVIRNFSYRSSKILAAYVTHSEIT